ncbi:MULTISPECIES: formylglycine-generating enzyme family protein [unclassified Roseofilum]|uniref:formylglycine-generating enzyme family protein n=1 Tax=unclassified Roseofilum TaxID=2620099 RepID=UPI001B0100BF|nr:MULTISPECIES: formylglycine-generating enzyme family protein [unclassified Roseofilum]MBP0011479.1 formylglycine-generating enzyme family protein [Roseofilum sp. Belize Diploria]MBP0036056.1 formylglycine-generating enzyme family protein [Roseofilum sp. Belize BBD 4]
MSQLSLSGKKLIAFDLETVRVNRRGEIIKRENHTAQYFIEDLGNETTLDMVAIPGGTFLMGASEAESRGTGGLDIAKPQHQVTLQPFFMGKYPITQRQWRAIADRPDLKVERDLNPNPLYFADKENSDCHPIAEVDWYSAMEFCGRLSKLTGGEYRLPSEAEWEYACRAGTSTAFYFGDTLTSELANYRASYTYADEPQGEYRKETTPVGQFPPNAFGLYDLLGNVSEWCEDDWHKDYEGASEDGGVWRSDREYVMKVIRSGSWSTTAGHSRSAYRFGIIPVREFDDQGLRVVYVPPQNS